MIEKYIGRELMQVIIMKDIAFIQQATWNVDKGKFFDDVE